jgi:uncharacterized membrane protein YqjE
MKIDIFEHRYVKLGFYASTFVFIGVVLFITILKIIILFVIPTLYFDFILYTVLYVIFATIFCIFKVFTYLRRYIEQDKNMNNLKPTDRYMEQLRITLYRIAFRQYLFYFFWCFVYYILIFVLL